MACRGSARSYGWAAHTSSNTCPLSHLHLATPLGGQRMSAEDLNRGRGQETLEQCIACEHLEACPSLLTFHHHAAPHYQCSLNSGGFNENEMKKKVEGPEALDICILCTPWATSQPRPKPHHICVNFTLILDIRRRKPCRLKGPSAGT